MIINNQFEIGQVVYLRSDEDQRARIVVQIAIMPGASLRYCLNCGTVETWHYEIEVSAEKDILKTTTN